jgi:hypothetical protein
MTTLNSCLIGDAPCKYYNAGFGFGGVALFKIALSSILPINLLLNANHLSVVYRLKKLKIIFFGMDGWAFTKKKKRKEKGMSKEFRYHLVKWDVHELNEFSS